MRTKPKPHFKLVKGNLYHVFHGRDWELMRYRYETTVNRSVNGDRANERQMHVFADVFGSSTYLEPRDVANSVRPTSPETEATLNELLSNIESLEAQIKETKAEIAQLADPV